jgi:hypothetical protein
MRGGRSRPEAATGHGLPPNDSCERWPSASNPQPTSSPANYSGVSGAGFGTSRAQNATPPLHRERTDRERSAVRTCGEDRRSPRNFRAAAMRRSVRSRSRPPLLRGGRFWFPSPIQ